ncbi:glycosyltransferase family 1 protein [Marinovum sp. SP66]|jgi:glycosyltransferase involved in cell wall biosynthesis|uniref:glycosyltransferase family 4 protein n=1 Tax=Marinovum sp. SP66 TaxID=3028379 RepID=UPI00237BC26C|nr:glycosyltransferase family 1 protein [Marinovum sp. SP66]MDD9739524.1 glycosyltransferase family 1 protein [Marinovum sp. SP66]
MRLAINARFLSQATSGVQRFGRQIVAALDQRLTTDPALRARLGPVVAYAPEGAEHPGWQAVELHRLPGGRGHAWEQTALRRAARGRVLFSPGNSGPLLHRRQVLVLHDANLWEIPEAYDWRYRALHRTLRPSLARRSAALVTVSRHSARQLSALLGVDAARFSRVPNAADHVRHVTPEPEILGRLGLGRQGYLLCVGNRSPNKNIAPLVAAHGLAGDLPPLVVVGGAAPGLAEARPGAVIAPGRVSDGALRALYEGAAGFVFPSRHEGFGIPPLEAMELGCPVLAARAGALPEVLGPAALWCDPASLPDMAQGLRTLAGLGASERAALIKAGQAQAAGYRWARSLDLLLPVLFRAGAGGVPALRPSDAGGLRRTG